MVEEKLFIVFCSILNPLFKMISADTLRKDIFRTYNLKRSLWAQFFMLFQGLLSFTTDLWTSANLYAMIAVTASFLTEDFRMVEVVLGFRQLSGDHSGYNIADAFYSILCDYNLQNRVSKNN